MNDNSRFDFKGRLDDGTTIFGSFQDLELRFPPGYWVCGTPAYLLLDHELTYQSFEKPEVQVHDRVWVGVGKFTNRLTWPRVVQVLEKDNSDPRQPLFKVRFEPEGLTHWVVLRPHDGDGAYWETCTEVTV